MEIRFADDRDDDAEVANGKVAIHTSKYSADAYVTVEELVELRAEIDKFLMRLVLKF